MLFDSERVSFEQKTIINLQKYILPLETSTIKNSSGLPINAQIDLHNFFINMYSKLSTTPVLFNIPVGQYDKFALKHLNSTTVQDLAKNLKAKEGKLRNDYQQPIHFYRKFLFLSVLYGQWFDHRLFLSNNMLEEIKSKINLSRIRENYFNMINNFTLLGINIENRSNGLYFSSLIYPDMFKCLKAISSSKNPYLFHNYVRLDFNLIYKQYIPDVSTIKNLVSKGNYELITDISNFLKRLGCNYTLRFLKHKILTTSVIFDYFFKNRTYFSITAGIDEIYYNFYLRDSKNITKMATLLYKNDYPLFEWFIDKIPEQECNCKNNRIVDLVVKKIRICGLANKFELKTIDSKSQNQLLKLITLFNQNFL